MVKQKILYLLIFIGFFSLNLRAYSEDTSLESQFYTELLEKHRAQGYLNNNDVKDQQFKYSNNKSWEKNFKNQVRGVASSLSTPREKITLSNPPIEISVK